MDKKQWKKAVEKQVRSTGKKLTELTPRIAYGTLSAATLLPFVSAATQGEYAVFGTLASLVSNVGVGLITSQIEAWKDRSQEELAEELAGKAGEDSTWQETLDALVSALEAPRAAQRTLSNDDDWERFQEIMQEALTQLGNAERYGNTFTAEVSGSGAVAQDQGIAAGAGGLAARKIKGNIKIINYFTNAPLDPNISWVQKARARYLQRLVQRCNALPLAPLGGDLGEDELTLTDVYVDLDVEEPTSLEQVLLRLNVESEHHPMQTHRLDNWLSQFGGDQPGHPERWTPTGLSSLLPELSYEQWQEHPWLPIAEDLAAKSGGDGLEILQKAFGRPLSAREAIIHSRRTVLLGDPGGGKSTFVRQLCGYQAALLAEHAADDDEESLQAALLPIFIELRSLTPFLAALDLERCSNSEADGRLVQSLWAHWQEQLQADRAEDFDEELADRMLAGRVLIVLDGLDELPSSLRPRAKRLVAALRTTYGTLAQVIVTSRVRSYTESVRLDGFDTYTLAPFDEDKIRSFIQVWYGAQEGKQFSAAEVKERTENLQTAALSSHLRELATNPMLLTTMAVIHQRKVGLPRERVRLYADAVEILVQRWQDMKGLSVSDELSQLLFDNRRLWPILERLAYEAHDQRQDREADLPRGTLLTLLEQEAYLGDIGLAAQFLDFIDQRAGLLIGRGGDEGTHPSVYSFPHRTFQEYLAGRYLLRGRSIHRGFRQKAAAGDTWTVAVLLAGEELLINRDRPQELMDLLYHLCPVEAPDDDQGWRCVLWSAQLAQIVGKSAIAADTEEPSGGENYLERVRRHLLGVMRKSALPAQERAEAGRALARLGDPRPQVLDPLRMEFVKVPAGPFLMGEGEEQFELTISYDYQIARYPVTQAQFQVFVDAGGYAQKRYWREAATEGYWQDGSFKGEYDGQARTQPFQFGEPFSLPNHPMVGVSWYEALAFVRWLQEAMQAKGMLAEDWQVCLPSEAEWEKAARGSDGRTYPWGEQIDAERLNYSESELGSISAVGCYPAGASPYGVEEMSGSVWEWCRTKWLNSYEAYADRVDDSAEGEEDRVLRGGSWGNNRFFVRCAFRFRDSPDDRNDNVGFRVMLVASPFPSEL